MKCIYCPFDLSNRCDELPAANSKLFDQYYRCSICNSEIGFIGGRINYYKVSVDGQVIIGCAWNVENSTSLYANYKLGTPYSPTVHVKFFLKPKSLVKESFLEIISRINKLNKFN